MLNELYTDRINLIGEHPLFSQFTSEEIQQLIPLLQEETYSPGQSIVVEGELVDSIIFIVNGVAEVRKQIIHDNTTENTLIATLNSGDVIGLSESGLYSITGLRTATVIAQLNMQVLKLSLESFKNFIDKHTHASEILKSGLSTLLSMHLLKKAAPFAKLKADNLYWLAQQIKRVTVPAGKIIFQKGDYGNECYLIEKGKIRIFLSEADQEEKNITILESHAVFGEIALILDIPRNATAQTLEDCELISIDRESLLKVMKVETDTASSLMKLMMQRGRPKKLPAIETHVLKNDSQETTIILKDPVNWIYYQISNQEWFIWKMLDGRHSLRDIAVAFNQKYKINKPGKIANFIMDLEESGFVEKLTVETKEEDAKSLNWLRIIAGIRDIMEASISFGQADQWVTKSYNAWVYLLYTYTAQILLAIIGIAGLSIFMNQFSSHLVLFKNTVGVSIIVIVAFSASMACILIHELAHAYTTKSFGRGIACFGVGWFWLGPVAFCDTSDVWLGTKRQRILVDLAGIYSDFILAGMVSMIALFFKNPYIILLLWLLSLNKYLAILYNLSPNIELDGYYLLMDVTGKDNLREAAIKWLTRSKLKWESKYTPEIIYWVVCLIYLAIEVTVSYYISKFLLNGLFDVKNLFFSLVLPVIAITLSSLSIWGEIKEKKFKKISKKKLSKAS